MITIITGSRDIENYEAVSEAIRLSGFEITEVVSGCAPGVDKTGERWARRHGVPIKRFPANWKQDGRVAGIYRNIAMAHYAYALVAVWDGYSKDTKHMIEFATKKGLRVYVYEYRTTS